MACVPAMYLRNATCFKRMEVQFALGRCSRYFNSISDADKGCGYLLVVAVHGDRVVVVTTDGQKLEGKL